MKIDLITAGTAGMYCGSCIRDNALAAELLRRGHEVRLIPLYTPTRTDEENVSQQTVFFGGISIYLEQYLPPFRRTPQALDRLWDSPLVLRALSKLAIRTDPRRLGPLTVSMLQGEDGHQNKELGKLIGWMRSQPTPDVVVLPNSLLIRLAGPIKEALGCTVCCTLQGEDNFLEGLREPYRTESLDLIRAHTGPVDAFLSVSDYYAGFMAGYLGIPEEKTHVVPLGINLEGYERARPPGFLPFTIGYFARITPEKGLHLLCEAYRDLRHLHGLPPSRLEAAGYLGPEHRGYLREIEQRMRAWGLAGEFEYRGALTREEKIGFLRNLDVLSVPGNYAEPKGLYMLEAMACGVPVIQPRHGAFPEILRKTGGGLLVEPNDRHSLAEAILGLWRNRTRAAELGRKGYEGVRAHYSVEQEAQRTEEVFHRLMRGTGQEEEAAAVPQRA